MSTPNPPEDLPGYDTLPWPQDILAMWIEADDSSREAVRQAMPELAATLDREAEAIQQAHGRRRAQWLTPPDQRRPVPWQTDEEG